MIDGQRCEARDGLEAHHLEAFRSTGSYNPAAGVCVCSLHHHLIERDAA